jgi:hypothetical protein
MSCAEKSLIGASLAAEMGTPCGRRDTISGGFTAQNFEILLFKVDFSCLFPVPLNYSRFLDLILIHLHRLGNVK